MLQNVESKTSGTVALGILKKKKKTMDKVPTMHDINFPISTA